MALAVPRREIIRHRRLESGDLEEIEADIRAIEGDIVRMLAEVTGGPVARQ